MHMILHSIGSVYHAFEIINLFPNCAINRGFIAFRNQRQTLFCRPDDMIKQSGIWHGYLLLALLALWASKWVQPVRFIAGRRKRHYALPPRSDQTTGSIP